MSNDRSRFRGNLFANADKKKPSQPDMQGDCTIDGAAYEIRAWSRDDQLAISIAPPRGDKNTYPPDVFTGRLDAVPPPKKSARDKSGAPVPLWTGVIVSDTASYTLTGFEKQGKHGTYLTLGFEPAEHEPKQRSAEFDVEEDHAS
ncbi:MAG: hypothetical protein ABI867_31840 [Kofleriaceae bacterium]